MKPFLLLPALMLAALLAAPLAAQETESVSLTVYNDGNAIVRETRTLDVPKGSGAVSVENVAATIDPTTVKFRSLTDPYSTSVLEQNYEYDLLSADKLLEKYLSNRIEVITEDGTVYAGSLVSFDHQYLVVAQGPSGPVRIIARPDNVRTIFCRELPEGLITRPTLQWLLASDTGGSQQIEIAYSASGCSWRADYTALLDERDASLDLSAWVTLTNNSGKTYSDAALKLMAGEVHRVEVPRARMMRAESAMAGGMGGAAFEEEAFAEYHLYTLPRKTTIKDRQIKQIELIPVSTAPCQKKYLFDPLRSLRPWWSGPMTDDFSVAEKGKVQVFIIFKNDRASDLGIPLPAGRVRLFKMNKSDMEFVGEDSIDHTPENERVELLMGNAFDLTAERTRTDFQPGRGENWMTESFEVKLRSAKKDEAVTVNARERLLRWSNWEVTASSHNFTKLDAQTIEFPVNLIPMQEETLTYTVRYEW